MKSEELLDAKIRFSITVTFSKFPLPRNEGAGRRGGTRAGVTARRRERRRNIGGAKSPRRFFVCRRVSLPAMPAPLPHLPPAQLPSNDVISPAAPLTRPSAPPRPMPAATFPLPHFEISVILPSPLSPGPAQLTINSDLGNTELLQEQRTLLFS